MKWFAGISIVLNITLAVIWWQSGKGRDVPVAENERLSDQIIDKTVIQTNEVDVLLGDPSAVPTFSWSMV